MKFRFFAALLFILTVSGTGFGQDGLAVLNLIFIGNSYTYVNDMPGMLLTMIDSSRNDSILLPPVTIHSFMKGGANLKFHWDQNRTEIESLVKKTTAQGDSVILILQDQSQAALTPASRARLKEYATKFAEMAEEYNAGLVLYQTWGRRETFDRYGNPRRTLPQFMYQEVVMGDTTVLDESITSANKGICRTYRQLGEETGAKVAPCGEAFAEAIRQGIFVHRLDEVYGSHPNLFGTYLVACTMFGTIFDYSPDVIKDNLFPFVWPGLAVRFQRIASEGVQGSLDP